nr:MAG TPA: hypothetical protein [Caudoviricetes sp.]
MKIFPCFLYNNYDDILIFIFCFFYTLLFFLYSFCSIHEHTPSFLLPFSFFCKWKLKFFYF